MNWGFLKASRCFISFSRDGASRKSSSIGMTPEVILLENLRFHLEEEAAPCSSLFSLQGPESTQDMCQGKRTEKGEDGHRLS